jgi:hypothetical protein
VVLALEQANAIDTLESHLVLSLDEKVCETCAVRATLIVCR